MKPSPHPSPARGDAPRALAWFGALCALFAAVWLRMPARTFYSPDEGAKYLQMRGLEGNPFRPCRLFYPGIAQDPEMFYYPARVQMEMGIAKIYPGADAEGRVQSNWLPWFPLATKPFFAWLGPRGLYFIPLLAGLFALWLTGAVASVLDPGARRMALTAFALASPILFYCVTFWEHTLALVLQLGALFCVRPRSAMENERRPAFAIRMMVTAAMLLGAIALRREAMFFAAALATALLLQDWRAGMHRLFRWRIPLLVAALVGIILLLILPPWLLPDRTGIDVFTTLQRFILPETWRHIPTHFFDVFFLLNEEESPLPSLLRWPGQIGLLACLANFFCPRARRPGIFGIGVLLVLLPAVFMAFTSIRYRALNSFALSAPFVLFALLPDSAPGVRSAAERFIRTTVLLLAVFYVGGTLPSHRGHGGLEWGSRYALALFSLLTAVGMANVLRWMKSPDARGWRRVGMQGIVLCSLLVGSLSIVRGVRELRMTRLDLARTEAALSAKAAPIVTDFLWMAAALPDLYMAREIYTIATPDEIHGWLNKIGQGEPAFVYASYEPLSEEALFREKDRLESMADEEVCGLTLTTYRVKPAPP